MTDLETLIETGSRQDIFDLLTETPTLATKDTSHGMSPILLACYYKKPEIAALIANFANQINLFEACALGKLEETAFITERNPNTVNAFSKDGFTPLGLAAYFGNEEITKLLISRGADANIPANNGYNVFPIHSAVASGNLNITKILINAGANVNVAQQAGFTPLHAAAQLGDIELIILLLEHSAEVDMRMEGGKLPSDLAKEKGFHEIAEILKV
ncbi:MAG: ankyrin repeat domain-containing protein [Candidatus Pedobacter colombiensis]|uniref:Ankyrin repeat domain-containing protein n=1 Tax=Candidatus Pedobacter colombiensis TaxID=3121371 RepID=A0AAJ5W7X6_9SPHI|nr:ankyrin repeat domain-containing protein [Pedobacter sp.]WEK18162.1 MAG: ankyrin repeat domain-containing protein [Pedobacter sp.]